MAKDLNEQPERIGKGSYEAQIDDDARSAYAEVMGRIKSAEGDDDAAEPVSKGAKEESRDDGRDERGRFAPKSEPVEKKGKADAQPEDAQAEDESDGEQELDAKAPAAAVAKPVEGAPPSFSVASKAEWAKLPDHVRADIVKREQEMGQGLKALQEYRDITPYAEMARQHGTTVPKALEHFVGMERMLRQNLPGGLATIAQNFGYNQQQAAQMFADMAAKLGHGQQQAQPDPLREALQPVLNPLVQQINAIQQDLVNSRKQAEQNQQMQSLSEVITQFKHDPKNTHFDALESDMALLMETGKVPRTDNLLADMKVAYELALRMNPQLQEALIEQRLAAARETERKKEQGVVDKARNSSRSLTGSKMPGTVVKDRSDASGSYEEELEADVRRAFRQHTQA